MCTHAGRVQGRRLAQMEWALTCACLWTHIHACYFTCDLYCTCFYWIVAISLVICQHIGPALTMSTWLTKSTASHEGFLAVETTIFVCRFCSSHAQVSKGLNKAIVRNALLELGLHAAVLPSIQSVVQCHSYQLLSSTSKQFELAYVTRLFLLNSLATLDIVHWLCTVYTWHSYMWCVFNN